MRRKLAALLLAATRTTNALRVPGALGAAAQTYARCMDTAPLATQAKITWAALTGKY